MDREVEAHVLNDAVDVTLKAAGPGGVRLCDEETVEGSAARAPYRFSQHAATHSSKALISAAKGRRDDVVPQAKNKWKRQKQAVDWKMVQANALAALIANMGLACAMVTNELVCLQVPSDDIRIDALKLINSVCTLVSVAIVYRIHSLQVLFVRINMHLTRGYDLQTVSRLVRRRALLGCFVWLLSANLSPCFLAGIRLLAANFIPMENPNSCNHFVQDCACAPLLAFLLLIARVFGMPCPRA